jgi:hypothetical protein
MPATIHQFMADLSNPYLRFNGKSVEFDLPDFLPKKLRTGYLYTADEKLFLKYDEFTYPKGRVFYRELTEEEIEVLKPHSNKQFDLQLVHPCGKRDVIRPPHPKGTKVIPNIFKCK